MILDDRPVIDQLLNPTPLNLVEEVAVHMSTLIDGAEYALGDLIYATLLEGTGLTCAALTPDARVQLEKELDALADHLADGECSRRQALMDLMAAEMEARL